MKNKSIHIAAVAAAVFVPLALFLHTFSASPLPKPEPYTGPQPSATPPQNLAVFSVVTGVNHRVTAFGYRGGSLFERRDFSMAGAQVKHPKGDLSSTPASAATSTSNFGRCRGACVLSLLIVCRSPPSTRCRLLATTRNRCVPFC